MNPTIKRCQLILMAILGVTLSLPSPALAPPDTIIDTTLDFKAAFPVPLYQKPYIAFGLTGLSVVAAGAFSYITAGGGAPAAAAGVSTVASWVAGGGAGSYMAGLSTIGGWFGGNAMLGSAVLNGISLGTTMGGTASVAALTAGHTAQVLSSITSMALDGVALVGKPDTKAITFQVALPIPTELADQRLGTLIKSLEDGNKNFNELAAKLEKQIKQQSSDAAELDSVPSSAKTMKLERDLAAQQARIGEVTKQVNIEIDRALSRGDTDRNTLVLAVLAHNLGETRKFGSLLGKIDATSGYLNYLRAVYVLQVNQRAEAQRFLRMSIQQTPYAIESPSLLVAVLGSSDFSKNKDDIIQIAKDARANFKPNAYLHRASLVSLHFRIGKQALLANQCYAALLQFKQAKDALSFTQKHLGAKDAINLVDVGRANALYCLGQNEDADAEFAAIRKRAKGKNLDALCAQYSGSCE